MTKQERIIRGLVAIGCKEVTPSISRKYRQFTSKPDSKHPDAFYWVGKMGGLRMGRTVTSSISLEYAVPKFIALGESGPTEKQEQSQ